jgi:hypothetical protein
MRVKYILTVGFLPFLSLPAEPAGPINIEGEWIGAYTLGEFTHTQLLVFHVEGNKLSGYIQEAVGGKTRPIREGEIIGDRFSAVIHEKFTITGKAVSPDELQISWPMEKLNHTEVFTIKRSPGIARTVSADQVAGVDIDWMGAYRALANLILAAARKNDWETAAKLSRVMEVFWDNNEPALKANSRDVWTQVDRAMDLLINPILEHKYTPVELEKLEAAFRNYIETLKVVR